LDLSGKHTWQTKEWLDVPRVAMLLSPDLVRFRCPSQSGLTIATKMFCHVMKQRFRGTVSSGDRNTYLDHGCVFGAPRRFGLVVNDPVDIGKRTFKLAAQSSLLWAFHRFGPPT
jgi:hypothetical protein